MLPPGAHQDGVQQPPSHEQTGGGGIGQAPQGTHHEPADGGPDFTSPPVMPTAESLDDQLKELQRMQETQMKSLGHSVSVPAAAEVALPPPVSPAAEMQVPNVQSAQGVVINQPPEIQQIPVQPVSQAQPVDTTLQADTSALLYLQDAAQMQQPTPESSLTPEANQALLNLQMLLQPPLDNDQSSNFMEPLVPQNTATEQQVYPAEPAPIRPPKPSHLQSQPVPLPASPTKHTGQQNSTPSSVISTPGSEIPPLGPSVVLDQSSLMRTQHQPPGSIPPELSQELQQNVPPQVQAEIQPDSVLPQGYQSGMVPPQMHQGPPTGFVPPQLQQGLQTELARPPQMQQHQEAGFVVPQMQQGAQTDLVPPQTQQGVINFNVPAQAEPYKAMSVFGEENSIPPEHQQPISPPNSIPTVSQPSQQVTQVQLAEPVSPSSFVNGDNTVTVNTLSRPITSPVQSLSSVGDQRDVISPVEMHRSLDQDASQSPNMTGEPVLPVLPAVPNSQDVPSVYPNYQIELEVQSNVPIERRGAPPISSINEHPISRDEASATASQPPVRQTPSLSSSLTETVPSSVASPQEIQTLTATEQQESLETVPPTIPEQSSVLPPSDSYSATPGPAETTELRLSHGIDTNLRSLPELSNLGGPPNFHGMNINIPPAPLSLPVLSSVPKEITTSLVGAQPSLSSVNVVEMNRLEEEVERQKKQIEEQKRRLQQQDAMVSEKTNQAENYRQQLALLQQQLGQLTSQQHKQEQEKVAASGQQAVLMQLLQQQQGMFSQQQAQIEKLSQVVESHQKEQQDAEIKHRQVFAVEQEQKSNLQSQVLSLTQEMQRLQQQLQAQAQQYQALQLQVYQYHTQIQERDKQLLAFRDQHREIVQKLEQKHQEKVSQLVHQMQELQAIVKKFQEQRIPPSMQQRPHLPPPLQPISAKQQQQQPLQAPLVPQQFQQQPRPPGTPQQLGQSSVPPSPATPLSQQPISSQQQALAQMRPSNYPAQGQTPISQGQIPMSQSHVPMSRQQQHPNINTAAAQWVMHQSGQPIQRQTNEPFISKQQQQQQQMPVGVPQPQQMIPSHSQSQPMLPSQIQQPAVSRGQVHIPPSGQPSLAPDVRRQPSPYAVTGGVQRQQTQQPPGSQMNPQTMSGMCGYSI